LAVKVAFKALALEFVRYAAPPAPCPSRPSLFTPTAESPPNAELVASVTVLKLTAPPLE
jgi:hypothetical protein